MWEKQVGGMPEEESENKLEEPFSFLF